MATLKPFVINLSDLAYLLNQVGFVPLFDGPTPASNGLVAFDPTVSDAYDQYGNQVWNAPEYDTNGDLIAGTGVGSFKGIALTSANVASVLGTGFPHVSSPIGVRDVSGLHNNLFGTQADWGAVDVPFRRDVAADFTNYATSPNADYTPGSSVIDLMPRIISRTITTAGVNLLREGPDGTGAFVEWESARYATDAAYAALIDAAGVDTAQLVEGAKVVAPIDTEIAVLDSNGAPLIWSLSEYQASVVYTTTLAVLSAASYGGLRDSTGGSLEDGEAIWYRPVPGGALVDTGQSYQADILAYKQLIDANVDFSGGYPANGTPVVATVSESGYGLLETLGHVDFQNPGSGEYFIGSENPGVAPVNSWFAIFGQFFDHGLDLIGKGGNGTITIELATTDPLYRAPGTNGPDDPGVTSMKVARATIAGTDANGDPTYVNHTSPFIDQSQTYGSVDQITQLLRKWVSTDEGASYHAGSELLDGQTLVDAWERRWPDGSSTMVHDTLPTLSELRQHVIDTGRDALSWEDVLNYRNRDASGHLSGGESGHALILDMSPHFDGATGPGQGHITQASIDKLNAALGTTFTTATFNVGAITPYLNPDFTINTTNSALHDAVSDILMDSVGDHYIAGDGRVNENFGLTSIHHVFHEEHNYQVENLKSWIYAHDANNPGVADAHEQLHAWQIDTGTPDDQGNYLNADGSIAWDADKLFNATKLIVEMEYQHAAVDQYARTVTPRIQEFVGYSTGVDATVSLEYAQVAFRFGHSTIRETLDTLDPDGWYSGAVMRFALERAFLAPQTFAEEGVAAITLGLTRQQMNEVDEFITPALTQGLLDQPLDLATINIARGRDLGIPTLNDFREGISLARYTSWDDFGKNMIHPESLVNFIAAYSFDGVVAKAEAVMGLFDGTLTDGDAAAMGFTAADALAFMLNNAAGNAELDAARVGFDRIDSWIGGLAEAHVPGGLLGETFDAVFVAQIQSLMDGDRFYYLYRLFGTQIHEEVNNGQFKDIVERNTGLSHLNGSIFAYADKYYDFNRAQDGTLDGTGDDLANHLYHDTLAANPTLGIFSDGGASTSVNGSQITVTGSDFVRPDVVNTYIRDARPELDPTQVHTVEGTPTSGADSHEVLVATDNADFIHARSGDDTVYGEGGNDFIYGDGGVDRLYGGDGDDMIDTGEGPDLADGGAGKDIIYGRGSGSEVGGFDQLVGGSGNDLIIGGEGIDKLSGGSGDDIIYGDGLTNPEMGNTDAFTHGGDGNDYIDTGASGDLLYGEEGDDYMVGGIDQDLIQGGAGDDILRPGSPSQAINGGPDEVIGGNGGTDDLGFDLIDFSDYAGNAPGIVADMVTQFNPLVAVDGQTPFPAWFQIEGVIGSSNDDTFIGTEATDPAEVANLFGGGNWLIGGTGNDSFEGQGGDDIIVGGSIRLDDLIGRYSDAGSPLEVTLGSAEWLAAAMDTATGGTGYDNNTEDAYTGASNRTADTAEPTGGLIEAANATGAAFDKHFVDMLKSRMFKDVVLGDNGNDSASTDVVVFRGNRADYDLTEFTFTDASGATVTAYKIVHARNAGGVDADGQPLPDDGTDLVVGVEKLQFADMALLDGQFLNRAPTGAALLSGFATANQLIGTTLAERTTPPFGPLTIDTSSIQDNEGVGLLTIQWQALVGGEWTDIAGATGATYDPATANIGSQLRAVVSYTDGGGVVERVVSVTSDVVGNTILGTNGNNTGAAALTGTAGQDILLGRNGNDTLNAGAGNDWLSGGIGTDTLNGGDGNDWLDGGAGNDAMNGGAGDDTYIVNVSGDQVVEAANAGIDTVRSAVTRTLGANEENLVLTGTGNLNGSGNTLDNAITGNGGNSLIIGNGGNDALDGGLGTDTAKFTGLLGEYSYSIDAGGHLVVTDTVAGRDGTDILTSIERLAFSDRVAGVAVQAGSNAAEVLTIATAPQFVVGGLGDDTFVFNSTASAGNNATRDVIGDFVQGDDRIDVSGIDADGRGAWGGDQAFSWVGTATTAISNLSDGTVAHGKLGYHFETLNGIDYTVIDGNVRSGVNDGSVNFQIALLGHHELADTDFIF